MKIHIIGICGTAMAALAGLLKAEGHDITGSDENVYPPMSTVLENLKIPVFEGYSEKNIHKVNPDLVVIGNVISAPNPEARAAIDGGFKYQSFPEILKEFFIRDKTSIVICGTHGKTTTTSMTTWILESSGKNPSYFVGGVPANFETGFRNTDGEHIVLEGDEYDTAFWDKVPKFTHYKPKDVILSSIEFDHADIYADIESILKAFEMLIEKIPEEGHLFACSDYENIQKLIGLSSHSPRVRPQCPVKTYGLNPEGDPDYLIKVISESESGLRFEIFEKSKSKNGERHSMGEFEISLTGSFNALNAAAAALMAALQGVELEKIQESLKSFKGVARRQQVVAEKNGIVLIDDFAHHPTAVSGTIKAMKNKYPEKRILAVWEPRSATSRRNIFQKDYVDALSKADLVFIPRPYDQSKIAESERFSSEKLIEDLKAQGVSAYLEDNVDSLFDSVYSKMQEGDAILVMSNGGFGGLIPRLKVALS